MTFKELLSREEIGVTDYSKYLKVAEYIGFDDVANCIPFDLETLKESYEEDQNFNTEITPIRVWNFASGFYESGTNYLLIGSDLTELYHKAGINCFSVSNGVSLLKAVAKKLVMDSLNKK